MHADYHKVHSLHYLKIETKTTLDLAITKALQELQYQWVFIFIVPIIYACFNYFIITIVSYFIMHSWRFVQSHGLYTSTTWTEWEGDLEHVS